MSDLTPAQARRALNELIDQYGGETVFRVYSGRDDPKRSELSVDDVATLNDIGAEIEDSEIMRKTGQSDADTDPSREFMKENDMGVSVGGTEIRVPLKVGPWEWSSPSDDPQAGLGQGPTTVARWTIGPAGDPSAVVAVRGRGTNYRAFYWPSGDSDTRRTLFGPVGGVEVVRNTVDELEDLPRAEETPQGMAKMQEAAMSDNEIRRDVRIVGEPGSRRYEFDDGTGSDKQYIPPSVYTDAIDAIEDELGDAETFQPGQNAGVVVFDAGGGEFIEYEIARSPEIDTGAVTGRDSESVYDVYVTSGRAKRYQVDDVSKFSSIPNRAANAAKEELGDPRQWKRDVTVAQITVADEGDAGRIVDFDPADDLVAIADYEADARGDDPRNVTATDISWRIEGDTEFTRTTRDIAQQIIRAEFGEPTEYPDGLVVGNISFENAAMGYVVSAIDQRLEGEPDDQQDVTETDLGGLEPEVVSSDDGPQTTQETFDPADSGDDDPPEFPTSPNEAARRAREQAQQRSLTGGDPDIDPDAQREADRKRQQREERARQRQPDDQATLGDTDDNDSQQGLASFVDDNGNGGGSGN